MTITVPIWAVYLIVGCQLGSLALSLYAIHLRRRLLRETGVNA